MDDAEIDPSLASLTPPAGGPPNPPDEDDDPVVATYNVFIKPPLSASRRLLVLQYPNKHDARRPARPPAEVRVKPRTGMVEVDMPLEHAAHYDKAKGVAWGVQLQKSTAAKSGGSHGLAGGFGVHAPPVRGGAGGRRPAANGGNAIGDDDEGGAPGLDWAEALRTDQVLRTQTLGGLWPEVNDCRYMVGVFQGENLHLTPAASLVNLRPQLHHIDAAAEQERLARPREGPGGGAGAPTGAGPGPGKEASSARAIHMTIKSAGEGGDAVVLETMADRLRAVQTEPWQRMVYVDDERDDAWAVYHETLFLEPERDEPAAAAAAAAAAADEDDAALAGPPGGDPELARKVGRLEARWGEEDLLRAVSGMDRAEVVRSAAPASSSSSATAAAAAAAAVMADPDGQAKAAAAAAKGKAAETKRPTRARAAPPKRAAATRSQAAKAGTASNAMEID